MSKKTLKQLLADLKKQLPKKTIQSSEIALEELTIEVDPKEIKAVSLILRDEFNFDTLIDLCGVDYLHHGLSEWETEGKTHDGYSRAVRDLQQDDFAPVTKTIKHTAWKKPRFAVVYHLLSVAQNQRIRVQAFLEDDKLKIDSVVKIWSGADWFEREAFDMFGIQFKGHPDLRRLLTDYGFVGHPFRKDFPLIGEVEMRYDAKAQKCVYEPVSIQPRTTVPKVIRKDHRYMSEKTS